MKREYGFNLTSSRLCCYPTTRISIANFFLSPVCKEKLARGATGTRGIKRKRTGEKLLYDPLVVYKRFLFPPKAVGALPIFIPDILFLLDNAFILDRYR